MESETFWKIYHYSIQYPKERRWEFTSFLKDALLIILGKSTPLLLIGKDFLIPH